ncbi:MAG TPA: hypothetical protein ENJ54_01050 [Chloroflexi bacterium]|nr:hypothetical protein [Chloroflexota bacterium]
MEAVHENTPVLAQRRTLTPNIWQMVREIAPVMHKSRLFGVMSQEQAVAIMLKGWELGLSLTASFEFIAVIKGRPTLTPQGALALAIQSGELEAFEVQDIEKDGQPWACKVSGKRHNGMAYTLTYTMDDARRAGLVKPDSAWETYPANMLRWRAIGFWLDVVMPDIIGGMKRADEFGAVVDANGDVVDGTWTEAATAQPQPKPQTQNETAPALPEAGESLTLNDLLARYEPSKVMEALRVVTGGRMPSSEEEVKRIAERLAGGGA